MGTDWSVAAYAPAQCNTSGIRSALETVFAEMITQMSHWEANSLISRFNRSPAGAVFQLPDEFYTVLNAALEIAEQTAGAFNPCLYDDVNAIGFGPVKAPATSPRRVATDWKRPLLDNDTRAVTQPGGCRLDLSAIAKGYAVDRMAATLKNMSVQSFLAEIGGEFVAGNVKPDLTPWWVSLDMPKCAAETFIAALCGGALATSGDTKRFRGTGDSRVSHIIPPPKPETSNNGLNGDLASVTVLAPSCMIADAWATALFAMGAAQGRDYADKRDILALFQYRDKPPAASRILAKQLERD